MLSAWANGADATQALVEIDNSKTAAYKGLAMLTTPTVQLYAANFKAGTIDVFDAQFKPVTLVSSGRSHRLSRGGDRQANTTLSPHRNFPSLLRPRHPRHRHRSDRSPEAGLILPEGLRPSDSPTRALARRFDGSLRSRGSLARSLATVFSDAEIHEIGSSGMSSQLSRCTHDADRPLARQELNRARVALAVKVFVDDAVKHGCVGETTANSVAQDRSFRSSGRPEYLERGAAVDLQDCLSALKQPGTKNGMSEKCRRFIPVGDRIPHRCRTASKSRQLRKDLPHPMRALPASPNLRERLIVVACLRFDEAIKVSHDAILILCFSVLPVADLSVFFGGVERVHRVSV